MERPRGACETRRFEAPIAEYDDRFLQEIHGIAAGAGVDAADVLALNVRTEIVYAAKARQAARLAGGCTAIAVLPEASASGETLLAQNWDWYQHSRETVVVLESAPDDGPAFVTVVEAGLLAKAGLNAAGLGLVTNALGTDADMGEAAVPYHVVLRAILDCETILTRSTRSSEGSGPPPQATCSHTPTGSRPASRRCREISPLSTCCSRRTALSSTRITSSLRPSPGRTSRCGRARTARSGSTAPAVFSSRLSSSRISSAC